MNENADPQVVANLPGWASKLTLSQQKPVTGQAAPARGGGGVVLTPLGKSTPGMGPVRRVPAADAAEASADDATGAQQQPAPVAAASTKAAPPATTPELRTPATSLFAQFEQSAVGGGGTHPHQQPTLLQTRPTGTAAAPTTNLNPTATKPRSALRSSAREPWRHVGVATASAVAAAAPPRVSFGLTPGNANNTTADAANAAANTAPAASPAPAMPLPGRWSRHQAGHTPYSGRAARGSSVYQAGHTPYSGRPSAAGAASRRGASGLGKGTGAGKGRLSFRTPVRANFDDDDEDDEEEAEDAISEDSSSSDDGDDGDNGTNAAEEEEFSFATAVRPTAAGGATTGGNTRRASASTSYSGVRFAPTPAGATGAACSTPATPVFGGGNGAAPAASARASAAARAAAAAAAVATPPPSQKPHLSVGAGRVRFAAGATPSGATHRRPQAAAGGGSNGADDNGGAPLGSIELLSPVRVTGAAAAKLADEAGGGRVTAALTPVRRSARKQAGAAASNSAASRPVEQLLEGTHYAYVPNAALLPGHEPVTAGRRVAQASASAEDEDAVAGLAEALAAGARIQ